MTLFQKVQATKATLFQLKVTRAMSFKCIQSLNYQTTLYEFKVKLRPPERRCFTVFKS